MIASLAQLSRYGEEIDDVGDEGVTAEDVEEGGDAKAFSPDVFHFERESEEVVVVD